LTINIYMLCSLIIKVDDLLQDGQPSSHHGSNSFLRHTHRSKSPWPFPPYMTPPTNPKYNQRILYEGGGVDFIFVLHPLLWPPYKTPRRRRNNPRQPTPFVCCPSLFK
jgi:hypothetical protein